MRFEGYAGVPTPAGWGRRGRDELVHLGRSRSNNYNTNTGALTQKSQAFLKDSHPARHISISCLYKSALALNDFEYLPRLQPKHILLLNL